MKKKNKNLIQKKFREISELNKKLKTCRSCPGMNLKGKTESAPGFKNPFSPIMIVGQSLCTQCMKVQEPFYKVSGTILDRAFEKLEIRKPDLFITNLVHCHPPNNRPSTEDEIRKCFYFLEKEIEIVKPKIIIGLGNDVANKFLGDKIHRREARYYVKIFKKKYPFVTIYHPAYIWRKKYDRKLVEQYIKILVSIMKPQRPLLNKRLRILKKHKIKFDYNY